MTSNEVIALTGGLMMAGVLMFYLYTVNKHQKELMKELNNSGK